MRVTHLSLSEFRNYEVAEVPFKAGPNLIVGRNGQGKTNLVEALAYLSTFSSHRVGAEGALVRIPLDEAEAALYEVCRDGGLLCHTLRFADGADTVTRTRAAWRDGAFSVSYTDTYAVTSLTLDGGRLTYVYDMPDNPPGTDHDGHIDTQEIFTIG